MSKRILKIVIICIIIGVGLVSIPQLFSSESSERIIELSSNPPQKELIKQVFSDPSGTYKGDTERVTISANGDIMFHGVQISSAYENGSYNFDDNFKHVKKYIQNADLALGNFETTTAGGQPTGYPVFNAPDETLKTLSDVGYDVLATANNHALDKGKNGIIRTIEKINENNMVNVGTYTEPGEHIYITEINGIKISILAYTYGLNGMDSLLTNEERDYMVNLIREDKIKKDIERSKELGADFTIAFMHWGNEYQLTPSSYQVELANDMFSWGADIILGSHPHVIQKSEIVEVDGEMKYIIHSMGNFISNQRRETLGSIANKNYTEDGVIVNITLEKDFLSDKSKIHSVNYIPTWVNRTGSSNNYKYEILPVKDALNYNLSNEIKSKLEESYKNTMGKMKLYRDISGN
ncbi:CapA family protein [Alkalibaculum sp. M08DMB]|uniref:CapA family protein n=1 Tax=Alkalibaculum sporogenes TaxID=2655001 RepID=A0A6A7K694_9FIRM|nr:CapA family protein [Alkalibaculum sporogenes]MPW24884.1 CapA family protein [Alkalibaculum sporogenes]